MRRGLNLRKQSYEKEGKHLEPKTIKKLRKWRDEMKAVLEGGWSHAPYELDLIDLIDALDKGDIDNWPRKEKQ